MEKLNRKVIISIICNIIICSSLIFYNNISYAENKTEENTINETSEDIKSSNANLKDFGIKPHDFSGFKPEITSYDVTVPGDAESVEIYAVLQDSNATISGTGFKNLEIGTNSFDIIVTAEDGTKKTYKINITRKDEEKTEEESTEEVPVQYSGDGLASLSIENLELSPKFDTVIYEYVVKYIGENTTLNIETTTTDPYYTVEITGNEELKEGENIINILVSDPDSKNIATYQITLNKSLVDEEAIAKEQEETRKKEQQKVIIGVSISLIIIIVIIVFIIKHRNNKAWAEEYSVPFTEEKEEESLPKLLRKNYSDTGAENINELDQGELTKEQAREEFLNNYNKDYSYDDYNEIEEMPRRKKHKGKRFK